MWIATWVTYTTNTIVCCRCLVSSQVQLIVMMCSTVMFWQVRKTHYGDSADLGWACGRSSPEKLLMFELPYIRSQSSELLVQMRGQRQKLFWSASETAPILVCMWLPWSADWSHWVAGNNYTGSSIGITSCCSRSRCFFILVLTSDLTMLSFYGYPITLKPVIVGFLYGEDFAKPVYCDTGRQTEWMWCSYRNFVVCFCFARFCVIQNCLESVRKPSLDDIFVESLNWKISYCLRNSSGKCNAIEFN